MGGSNELRTLGFSCAHTMLTYDPGRCRTNPAQKYLPAPLEPLLSCEILDGAGWARTVTVGVRTHLTAG